MIRVRSGGNRHLIRVGTRRLRSIRAEKPLLDNQIALPPWCSTRRSSLLSHITVPFLVCLVHLNALNFLQRKRS